MGQWKLGYPNGLSTESHSYEDGKEMYNSFGVEPIVLADRLMNRGVGKVQYIYNGHITCINATSYPNINNNSFQHHNGFANIEFADGSGTDYGFMRMLSGGVKNAVCPIWGGGGNAIYCKPGYNFHDFGFVQGDLFEIVSGASTFTFPPGRNPIRRDLKRTFKGKSLRLPYYEGGLVIPEGYEEDDMVIMTYFTDKRDADRLELMLNHLLDFRGTDGLYSTGGSGDNSHGLAPMVLETGSCDIMNQYLIYISDYKIVKDAKRTDDFYEILLHFQNYSKPLYRGI